MIVKENTRAALLTLTMAAMSSLSVAQDSVVAAFHGDVPSRNGFGYRLLNDSSAPVPGTEQLDPFGVYDLLSDPIADTYFESEVVDINENIRQVRMIWRTSDQSIPFWVPSTTVDGEMIENSYFFLGWTNADAAEDGGYIDPEYGQMVSTTALLSNSAGSVFDWNFEMDEYSNGFTGWAGWGGPDSTVYQISRFELIVNYTIDREPCIADINHDGALDFFDISLFVSGFQNGDMDMDLNEDGGLNYFDVSDFIAYFKNGCP